MDSRLHHELAAIRIAEAHAAATDARMVQSSRQAGRRRLRLPRRRAAARLALR